MNMLGGFLIITMMASVSFADVLFLDFNNSPQEIKAAKAAAEKRGEKLIVLNTNSKESIAKELAEMDAKIAAAKARPKQTDDLVEILEFRRAVIEKPPLTQAKFSKEIKKLKDQGVKVTSLILSGHDGNGSFTGVNGGLYSPDIQKAFAENAPFADGVRSVILAGCYTGTVGAFEANWKVIAPNIELLAGYDGSAPAGDKIAGHDYITEILGKEKSIIESKDKQSLEKAFRDIKNINNLSASVCVGENVVSKDGVASITELKKLCDKYLDGVDVKQWQERINCFARGDKGCEDIPDPASGELRQIYNKLQAISHCYEPLSAAGISNYPLDSLIKLVLFKNAVKNFDSIHGDWIKQFNGDLADAGLSPEFAITGVSKLNRKQLYEKLQGIENFLTRSDIAPAKKEALADRAAVLRKLIFEFDCIPFNWVEPGAKEKSSCIK